MSSGLLLLEHEQLGRPDVSYVFELAEGGDDVSILLYYLMLDTNIVPLDEWKRRTLALAEQEFHREVRENYYDYNMNDI